MVKTVGRKFADFKNQSFGRRPLRFNFEIVPVEVVDLPSYVKEASCVWERGSKLCYTDPETVDSSTGCVSFKQIMRQSATLYREENRFQAKEYTFKIQSVNKQRKKTVLKAKLDLAQFCDYNVRPDVQRYKLQLQPQGCLVLDIKAIWLQNFDAERAESELSLEEREATDDKEQLSQHESSELNLSMAGLGSDVDGPLNTLSTSTSPRSSIADSSDYLPSPAGLRPRHRRFASQPPDTIVECEGDVSSGPSLQMQLSGGTPSRRLLQESASARSSSGGGGGGGGSGQRSRLSSIGGSGEIGAIVYASRAAPPASAPAAPDAKDFKALLTESLAILGSDGSDADADAEDVPAGPRSWWPFSRESTTPKPAETGSDELVQQIEGATSIADLQKTAMRLLHERDGWRRKNTQSCAEVRGLQQQVQVLSVQKTNMLARLKVVEQELGALKDSVLLHELVGAKVDLAQADLQITSLKGQLTRERQRCRQYAAKLTHMEQQRDLLIDQQQPPVQEAPLVRVGGQRVVPDTAGLALSARTVRGNGLLERAMRSASEGGIVSQ